MSLKERLQLEYEILERIDENREEAGMEEVSAEVERAIIERELADLEKQQPQGEGVLVLKRRRAA
jgi:hypothetical protein